MIYILYIHETGLFIITIDPSLHRGSLWMQRWQGLGMSPALPSSFRPCQLWELQLAWPGSAAPIPCLSKFTTAVLKKLLSQSWLLVYITIA